MVREFEKDSEVTMSEIELVRTLDCLELVPETDEVVPVNINSLDEQISMDCTYQQKHNPQQCTRLGGHCLLYTTGQYKLL